MKQLVQVGNEEKIANALKSKQDEFNNQSEYEYEW